MKGIYAMMSSSLLLQTLTHTVPCVAQGEFEALSAMVISKVVAVFCICIF